jgi:hypothetical protein
VHVRGTYYNDVVQSMGKAMGRTESQVRATSLKAPYLGGITLTKRHIIASYNVVDIVWQSW